jgi:hypothetical protein
MGKVSPKRVKLEREIFHDFDVVRKELHVLVDGCPRDELDCGVFRISHSLQMSAAVGGVPVSPYVM